MDRKSLILVILFSIGMFFFNTWFFNDNKSKTTVAPSVVVTSAITPTPTSTHAKDEKFYIIENEYQQIVFSNVGGAVTEINLPFKTDLNKQSIVLPIEPDIILKEKDKTNANFPLDSYYIATSSQSQTPKVGGYYPLLRRGIKGDDGQWVYDISPTYYGLTVLSDEDDSLASAIYSLKNFDNESISFELTQNQRKITKTYRFAKTNESFVPYSLILDIQVQGDSRGLMLSSGVPEVEIISSSPTPEIKYYYQKNKKSVVEKLKLPKDTSTIKGIIPEWVCNSNGFFGIIMNPFSEKPNSFEASFVPGVKDPTKLSLIDRNRNLYPPKNFPGYLTFLPLKTPSKAMSLRIFAGPLEQAILQQVDLAFKNPETGVTPNFAGTQSLHGWFSFISEPFAKFLFVIMRLFYSFTHSWVFSIFLLTLVLKVILYPLNNWSMKSMAKMQEINPQVQAIKAKYANDPKRLNLETMQLYKDKNANPFSSCLPMIIQLPFLLGMFDLLKTAFQLRGASFIPGWIDNLTSADVLFSWNYPIPFFGNQFHLLPFLLGGLMFLQQKATTWMSDQKIVSKTAPTDAEKQAKMMGIMMPILFTFMFYNGPSGLNLYWIFSTVLGILQQYILSKRLKTPKKNGSKIIVLKK